MPNQQDILNNLSKFYASKGQTVAPTVEAIRAFNEPKKEIPIDKPVLPNVGGEGVKGEVEKPAFDYASLISASKPAVNEADIQAQAQRELTAKKGIIESRYGVKIGEAKEQSEQEERALEGQMGTRRRFSSSASAFLQFVDEKNKKEIANLEIQKQDALASADFEYAQLVEQRIAKARQQSQQEFENMFKIIEYADKKQAEEAKAKDTKTKAMKPYIKSAKDSFTLKMLESGETDMGKILDAVRKQFPDASFDDVAKIQKGMAEANSEIRKQEASDFVSDALSSGLKDVNDIYRQARLSGIKIDAKDIASAVKDLQVVEKAAPGIIGEWMALKENAPEFKDLTLEGYLKMKDPTRALDVKEKQLQIKKLEKDLETKGLAEDPIELLGYQDIYEATGKMPTGMPKGAFGIIAQGAKESPKAIGTIVNTKTGVKDAKLSSPQQEDFAALYDIIQKTARLKELDKNRVQGLVSGTLGKIFGSEAQGEYLSLRKSIVDDIARMQTGAALTEDEQAFYNDYLPGRVGEVLGVLGRDTQSTITNFEKIMNERLENRSAANGLSIYGYSKIKIKVKGEEKEYKVGDIITNEKGESGRILPDGSIVNIEE